MSESTPEDTSPAIVPGGVADLFGRVLRTVACDSPETQALRDELVSALATLETRVGGSETPPTKNPSAPTKGAPPRKG